MFGYFGDLHTMTFGRGQFSMEFSHYGPCPKIRRRQNPLKTPSSPKYAGVFFEKNQFTPSSIRV
jgi:translation elongation factor EF-G